MISSCSSNIYHSLNSQASSLNCSDCGRDDTEKVFSLPGEGGGRWTYISRLGLVLPNPDRSKYVSCFVSPTILGMG